MNISYGLLSVILATINLLLLLVIVFRKTGSSLTSIQNLLVQANQNQDQLIRNEFRSNREEASTKFQENSSLISEQMQVFANHQNQWFQSFNKQINNQATQQNEQLTYFRQELKQSVTLLQEDNHKQLEKMRETVDEKLQKTLETRLGQSFELVRKHLEAVQVGLGEMKNLASGVGDLKKVLSNVKTRGIMGEMLLGNILEQILSPDQYSLNVKTIPHSSAHVEFAIKFPGQNSKEVWLPIDSKFPMDVYEHLIDAYDNGTPESIDRCQARLVKTVYLMAKEIKEKYVSPPHTTDFAILFLPIEGLYAELARNPGMVSSLQSEYKIMLAGPSNLSAFLNSLQLGFKTLAIEKRSGEVWNILSSVKTEFARFGTSLEKVQTKLTQASKTIDDVGVRSRAIERNLRKVSELPETKEALAKGIAE